jgi:predicted RNA-binding protein (virulence factor B family)
MDSSEAPQNSNKQLTKNNILDQAPKDLYSEGQPVELIIKGQTDLGYKVIVDQKYWGVLYYNEVFKPLDHNSLVEGFVKKIREDGKLDLTLYKSGTYGLIDIAQNILDYLDDNNGFLAITDKSEPEKIYELFGVSKKKFKMTIGGLYKKRIIRLEDDGIHLNINSKGE